MKRETSMKRLLIAVLIATPFAVGGCKSEKMNVAGFAQQGTKENFLALFKKIKTSDVKTAASLTRSLFPDEARLRKGLRDDIDAEIVKKISAMQARFSKAPDEAIARMLSGKPHQTEVQAHGATTEQIAANEKGSIVFKEFPGGAVSAANKFLRPKVTFYEVEWVAPGETRGMKYHLFYWDGSQWSMLGPVWRALRSAK